MEQQNKSAETAHQTETVKQPERTPYSNDGYIVDQARLTTIKYGVFTSDINGCGWIAAYNFLKRFGQDVQQQQIADDLIRHSLFHGLMGTDLFRLRRKMKQYGYRMPIRFNWNKKARLPEGTSAGIIYYCHKDGFHFVTFYADETLPPDAEGEARFRFLNGIGGKGNHFDTMRGFLTTHNVIPFALIMVWPGKANASTQDHPPASV